MGEVRPYDDIMQVLREYTEEQIMTDIIEDLLAFNYATTGRLSLSVNETEYSVCGCHLEENEEGELFCPKCGED